MAQSPLDQLIHGLGGPSRNSAYFLVLQAFKPAQDNRFPLIIGEASEGLFKGLEFVITIRNRSLYSIFDALRRPSRLGSHLYSEVVSHQIVGNRI
jgi:hypothetical protein